MPYFPILEVSTVVGCRMACKCCPQAIHVRRYAETGGLTKMTLETFKQVLGTVPANVRISFAGMAEPWLNAHATAMVEHALNAGHEVSIYTTLSGMTLDDVRAPSRRKFVEFVVHLPDDVGIMKLNVNDAYLEVLHEVRRVIPHHYSVIGPLHRALVPIVGKVNDDSSGIFSRAGNLTDRAIPRKTGPLACSACGPKIDHNILLPNGDVTLCCQDYSLKHILGNLLKQSWDSLFEGEAYQRVMRGLDGDESIDIACRHCELAVSA